MPSSLGLATRVCGLLVLALAVGCGSASPTTPSSPQTPPPSNAQAALESIELAAASVDGESAVTGTVTLSAAAPAAGFSVTLASSSEAVTVPATVTIAAGATSGTFSVTTEEVGLERTATITATAGDVSRTATLAIQPAPGDGPIAAFTSESDDLIGGDKMQGSVALSAPAPDGGVRFTLASSDEALDVPASITVPEGASSAAFEIETRPVSVETNVTVTITTAAVTAGTRARRMAAVGDDSVTLAIRLLPEPAAPPTLTSLSPSTGVQGTTVAITLTGTAFIDGASIEVSGAGVAVSGVTIASEASIEASFAIDAGAATGAREVTVTTSAGTSGAQTFTITTAPTPAPTLTAISPTSGSRDGGTAVTLTGTNLTGATEVTFDGVAATAVTVVNTTTVTATTPAHAPGAVDVVVTTPGGSATLASGFTYTGPTLTSITASTGSASGGVGVTLTGTNFTGATGVKFDGVAATSVNVVNSTTVTAVTPAHAAGAVDVAITTPGGSATLTNGFTYVATAVGQAAHGGKIAALNGGNNNLIAATADNSAGVESGGRGTLVGAGAQSTTNGASNTTAIVNALGAGTYAAEVCSAYEVDSQGNTSCEAGNTCYNDWFLPAGNNLTATGQLNALFTNRVAIGGFANDWYWSSTEFDAVHAYGQNFGTGQATANSKNLIHRVRCVRAFTPGG